MISKFRSLLASRRSLRLGYGENMHASDCTCSTCNYWRDLYDSQD